MGWRHSTLPFVRTAAAEADQIESILFGLHDEHRAAHLDHQRWRETATPWSTGTSAWMSRVVWDLDGRLRPVKTSEDHDVWSPDAVVATRAARLGLRRTFSLASQGNGPSTSGGRSCRGDVVALRARTGPRSW